MARVSPDRQVTISENDSEIVQAIRSRIIDNGAMSLPPQLRDLYRNTGGNPNRQTIIHMGLVMLGKSMGVETEGHGEEQSEEKNEEKKTEEHP